MKQVRRFIYIWRFYHQQLNFCLIFQISSFSKFRSHFAVVTFSGAKVFNSVKFRYLKSMLR